MKIIHSFWSKPSFHGNQDYRNARKFGGWLNFKYFLFSQTYSCLTLKRHHSNIHLYTDTFGADLFVNQLNLPYTDVSLLLDSITDQDHRLWIIGKLLVIKQQETPFIHVDNDVFVWENLPARQDNDFVVVQSELAMPAAYVSTLTEVQQHFVHIPHYLLGSHSTITNVGVIGGNNIDLFQDFCDTSSEFLLKNMDRLENVNVGGLNQILEEYLFSSMLIKKGISPKFVVDVRNDKAPMASVLRFNMVPYIDKYIHLVGSAKQNFLACEQLELRLKFEFPKEYDNMKKFILENYNYLNEKDTAHTIRRAQKITDVLKKMYSLNVDEIQRMKLVLAEDVNVESNKSKIGELLIEYNDHQTGSRIKEPLSGEDNLLCLFKNPVSIDEILEEYKSSKEPIGQEYDVFYAKFLDWVTENLVITKYLEFYS